MIVCEPRRIRSCGYVVAGKAVAADVAAVAGVDAGESQREEVEEQEGKGGSGDGDGYGDGAHARGRLPALLPVLAVAVVSLACRCHSGKSMPVRLVRCAGCR